MATTPSMEERMAAVEAIIGKEFDYSVVDEHIKSALEEYVPPAPVVNLRPATDMARTARNTSWAAIFGLILMLIIIVFFNKDNDTWRSEESVKSLATQAVGPHTSVDDMLARAKADSGFAADLAVTLAPHMPKPAAPANTAGGFIAPATTEQPAAGQENLLDIAKWMEAEFPADSTKKQ